MREGSGREIGVVITRYLIDYGHVAFLRRVVGKVLHARDYYSG